MEFSQPKPSSRKPLVSVVIPTYNNAHYIRQAVDSALSQTYSSYEVIVIDDGSTDETCSVLRPYNGRIQYICQDNQGVSSARNHGIRIARGEFISFLDSDDYFLPNKLAEQISAFEIMPSLGILHSGWRMVNEEGQKVKDVEPWSYAPQLDLERWLLWKPVLLGAMMFRKEYLEKAGGFDTSLRQAEDVDLTLRLALMGCKAVWLRKPTVCYRLHGGNTIKDGIQQANDLQTVLDKFYNLPNVPYGILKKERATRYYTLMWIVWHLYQTGCRDHITAYLKKSLKLSVYFPTKKLVVLDWAEQLSQHCIRDGCEIGEMCAFWPYFKDAVQLDNDLWRETENALNWWLDVWWHYLCHDRLQSIKGISTCKGLIACEITKRAAAVMFVCTNTTVDMVSLFWRDAMEKGIVVFPERHEVTVLYLSVFSEAVFGLRWRKALRSFCHAVQSGLYPRAWQIWFRFFQTSVLYIKMSLIRIATRIFLIPSKDK